MSEQRIAKYRRQTAIIIGLLRFYQRYISVLKPVSCRFWPSCSEYSRAAIEKYGVMRGSLRALGRIIRCHPFSAGGYDPA